MNRELTQDECRDQRTLLKILERNKLAEWLGGAELYEQVIRNLDAMQITGTTDGEEYAELTDDDAKERTWVMVRDHETNDWRGPYRLLSGPPVTRRYLATAEDEPSFSWKYARPLTQQEKERYQK